MSTYANRTFYGISTTITHEELMAKAKPYMYNHESIEHKQSLDKSTASNEPTITHEPTVTTIIHEPAVTIITHEPTLQNDPIIQIKETAHKTITHERFSPLQQDTLFWCIYIIAHGYGDYLQIGRNYGIKELSERHKIGEFVKQNTVRMKQTNYKITGVALQEIMAELIVVQKQTSMLSLIAMTVYYNFNVIIVLPGNKTYCEFLAADNEPTYLITKDGRGKYSVQFEPISTEQRDLIKSSMYRFEHYNKPIKSMTSYKVDELSDIARQLGILDETKKYKKPELYALVNEQMPTLVSN